MEIVKGFDMAKAIEAKVNMSCFSLMGQLSNVYTVANLGPFGEKIRCYLISTWDIYFARQFPSPLLVHKTWGHGFVLNIVRSAISTIGS